MEQEISTGEIEQTLRLFVKADAITELRVVDGPRGRPVSGYFDPDHLSTAAKRAAELSGHVAAVYFVPNPVKPELLARAHNRIEERPKQTTSDHDIRERRWLLIDLDPKRAAGISASEVERDAAFAMTDAVQTYLHREGWPDPVLADSGNGFHLVYQIDLPNDEPARVLVEGVLKALDFLFSNEQVVVDTSTYNAARIWKLYGTLARKGDQTEDRPHRPSSIVLAPEALEPVPAALLGRLAGLVPKPPTHGPTSGQMRFDLAGWIRSHVEVAFEGPWQGGGYRWILRQCPWNPDHTNRSAFILRFPSGAPAAGCRHDGCKGKNWYALHQLLDPEYAASQERRRLRLVEEPHLNGNAAPKKSFGARLVDIEFEAVRWLWPGYLPRMLCDLQGDPGTLKSTIAASIAGSITAGLPFPDGSVPEEIGNVIYVTTEDIAKSTLGPRLAAAGCDPNRVIVRTLSIGGLLTFPDELPDLEATITEEQARLVVLDPLDAFLSDKVDTNKNQSVRRVLAEIATLSEKTDCCFMALRHLNKDVKVTNPMYRGGGSIGMNAASRAVFMVGFIPEQADQLALCAVKNNLTARPASILYRCEVVTLPSGITTTRVVWGEVTPLTAHDLLKEPEKHGHGGHRADKLEEVVAILEDIFSDGMAHLSTDVEAEIASRGDYSHGLIAKARKISGISAQKNGFKGGWKWYPPSPYEESQEEPQDEESTPF